MRKTLSALTALAILGMFSSISLIQTSPGNLPASAAMAEPEVSTDIIIDFETETLQTEYIVMEPMYFFVKPALNKI